MSQFICPSCGSEYFMTSKTGTKTIFKVGVERVVQIIQSATEGVGNVSVDDLNIFCGACSWHGSLEELVASHTE